MARPKKFFCVVAMSVESAAVALDTPRAAIKRAIQMGELPAYRGPGRRTRLAAVDLLEWLRSWPKATLKRKVLPHD